MVNNYKLMTIDSIVINIICGQHLQLDDEVLIVTTHDNKLIMINIICGQHLQLDDDDYSW